MKKAKQVMSEIKKYPLLPLRDVVVFPYMVIQLYIGRDESIKALEIAMESDTKLVFLVAQKEAEVKLPKESSLYKIGTVATVLQMLRLPDGTVKVLVEGMQRASMEKFYREDGYCSAEIAVLTEPALDQTEPTRQH